MSEQLEDYQRALSEIAAKHNDAVSCREGQLCAGCIAARVLEKWQGRDTTTKRKRKRGDATTPGPGRDS